MDEDSMNGRPLFAHITNRHCHTRRGHEQVINQQGNSVTVGSTGNHSLPTIPRHIANRPHGGISMVYSFGDCNQLPPVGMKACYDRTPGAPRTADYIGRMNFSDFLNPPDETRAQSTIVIMEEVVRQNNPFFLRFLGHIRDGTMQNEDIDFIHNNCLANLSPDTRKKFDNALNLVTQWKQAHGIVFDYLQNTLTEPIAKMTANLQTTKSNGTNCCVKESSLPIKNAMCVGSIVMLLTNELVEMGLLNGSIGTVKDICYQTNACMGQKDADFYVVVQFNDSTLQTPLIPGKPTTWIPIALTTQRCECKRCTITAIPLRVCKALTIYKSQGMTVGPGKPFESLVMHLPTKGVKRAAGSELVGCSRVTAPEILAFVNYQNWN
ncbi:hypothetical protein ACHAXR_003194 [Thalassiosira sp. AJA248-18]